MVSVVVTCYAIGLETAVLTMLVLRVHSAGLQSRRATKYIMLCDSIPQNPLRVEILGSQNVVQI